MDLAPSRDLARKVVLPSPDARRPNSGYKLFRLSMSGSHRRSDAASRARQPLFIWGKEGEKKGKGHRL